MVAYLSSENRKFLIIFYYNIFLNFIAINFKNPFPKQTNRVAIISQVI